MTAAFKLGVAVSYLERISNLNTVLVECSFDAGRNEEIRMAISLADAGLKELRSYAIATRPTRKRTPQEFPAVKP